MKKTFSLILAMVVSLAIFAADLSGLVTTVQAEDSTGLEDIYPGDPADDPMPDPGDIPDPAPAPAPSEDEQAKQQAYEEAAKQAEEAANQAQSDPAAEAARQQAEADAAAAQKAAQDAQKAADEAKQKEEASNYQLTAFINGSKVSKIDFGTLAIGVGDSRVLQITNSGSTSVKLISTKTNDADGVFTMALQGGSTTLAPTESVKYLVTLKPSADSGTYKADLLFADADKDPNYTKGLDITVKATVKASSSSITGVTINPSKIRLAIGSTYPFVADVKGKGDFDDSVNWSVANANAVDTRVDKNGLLTIASYETAGSITVVASSVQDPSVKGYATITLQSDSFNVSAQAVPANGGVVTGGGAVSKGGSVTLSAVPNQNFYFAGWVQNGKTVSTSTNYTITNVQSDMTLTAKFVQNYVTVTALSNNNLAGTVVGGGKVSYGGKTTLSAKANPGYVFTGWKEGNNILSTAASLELNNLTVDRTITAIFAQTSHTIVLAASPAEGGQVSGGGTFPLGQGTTVKAVPNTGWAFQGWAVNGQIVSKDATVKIDKIDQDYSFTAVFIRTGVTTFTISAGVATTGGAITPSGKTVVPQGQNVTYAITPKSGYAILAVAVDGIQVGPVPTYTFTNVQAPHTIAAAFLLTDAGKAAQQAAGKQTQTNKVEKVDKTESNTATEDKTVSLEEAASGEAGDNYVEEMEGLDNIPVPSDEELGDQIAASEESYGTLALMGLSVDEANQMIANGAGPDLLLQAYYDGAFKTSVVNDLAPVDEPTDYSNLSMEELEQMAIDDFYPSFPNLDSVVNKMMTDGETLAIANGGEALIGISLTKQDKSSIEPAVEKEMNNAVGQKPLQYFDLTIMKSVDGATESVSETEEPMEIVIAIPDDIYQAGKTYSILRVHNGELTVLPDLDDNPKTITFRTDRFSTYAIAQQVATTKQIVIRFAIGAIITLAIAVTCFLILMYHQARVRKARRRERIERMKRERNNH